MEDKIRCVDCQAFKPGTKEPQFCNGTGPPTLKHICKAGTPKDEVKK